MALASTNPIRLSDAHLMCTCEFLITPYKNGYGQPLSWLTFLPGRLSCVNSPIPDTELATSLVIASSPTGVRTGVVLRMRMLNERATAAQCQEAMSLRLPRYEKVLAEEGLRPVRPLASEGVYALLPHAGVRFICRARNDKGQPLYNDHMNPLNFSMLKDMVANYPGSGLCITFLPDSITEEFDKMDFLIASWGFPEGTREVMEMLNLPLEPFSGLTCDDPLAGFQFLYDPWAVRFRVGRPTWGDQLVSTSMEEMTRLLGLPTPPPAPEPEPKPEPQSPTPTGMAGDARKMLQSMTLSAPDLREQMRSVVSNFRTTLQDQVKQNVSNAVSGVQQELGSAMQLLQETPGAQLDAFESALERVQRLSDTLPPPQLAAEARAAGLDVPIDTLTLMKMGFSSEQALLDAGLTPDLLSLLRSTVQLRSQFADQSAGDVNCVPYAFMVGYMYEALISRFFAPLFRATGGSSKAHHLSDFTRVNADHMRRMSDYARTRESSMRTYTADDWAVWMTLFNMLRSLRNRQHSDKGTGYMDAAEMIAGYEAFLFPGSTAKRTLVHLPAFSDAPPAWSKEFQPALPDSWGATPKAQRDAVALHLSRHASAFQPSFLQFLLRCGKVAREGDSAC